MNLKLSITILISSAYFLTLFIFNMSKNQDILRNLSQSALYASILFVIVYTLSLYIEYVFNDLKKKESQYAIDKIKQLELEHMENRKRDMQARIDEIDKEILNKEKESFNKRLSDFSNNTEIQPTSTPLTTGTQVSPFYVDTDTQIDEISEMKKESGTQFESNFNTENISI